MFFRGGGGEGIKMGGGKKGKSLKSEKRRSIHQGEGMHSQHCPRMIGGVILDIHGSIRNVHRYSR